MTLRGLPRERVVTFLLGVCLVLVIAPRPGADPPNITRAASHAVVDPGTELLAISSDRPSLSSRARPEQERRLPRDTDAILRLHGSHTLRTLPILTIGLADAGPASEGLATRGPPWFTAA